MARAEGSGLAPPTRGSAMLRFEGQAGEVTGHSSYWTDQGYRVTEWSCETEDVEAYLPQLFYLGASLLIGWSL